MAETFTLPAIGMFTQVGPDPSIYITGTSNAAKARSYILAGPGSRGLVVAGAAVSPSIQFGTGANDPIPNTEFTATQFEQEGNGGAVAPERMETEADGSQSIGYGRVRWDAKTGFLTTFHKPGDALVSGHPRVQVFFQRQPHLTLYQRYYLQFQLGTAEYPWPAYVASAQTDTLIFQIKDDLSAPCLGMNVLRAVSGDTTRRDLAISMRTSSAATPTREFRVPDISIDWRTVHSVILDTRLHWLTPDQGGWPYLAMWCNGQQIVGENVGGPVFRGLTAYPIDGGTVQRGMIGIYRFGHDTQAPEGCAVVWRCLRMEQSMTPPPFNTAGLAAFGMPGNALV